MPLRAAAAAADSARRSPKIPSAGRLFAIGAVMALLIAAGCWARGIAAQHALIQRIEQNGGRVVTEPVGPEWLRRRLSAEPFRGVDRIVVLQWYDATDDDLAALMACRSLQGVGIESPHVTDDGLRHLSRILTLQGLGLTHCPKITNKGVRHLGKLTELKWLMLDSEQVSDEALADVARLPRLRLLTVDSTGVTDAGLQHLHGAASLAALSARSTRVTVHGVAELQLHRPGCHVEW